MKAKSLLLVVIALMIAVTVALPAKTVYAGTNGQQLVITSSPSTAFTISGTNQNGQKVTKTAWVGASGKLTTTGYWWVGTVKVTAYSLGGFTKTCSVYVPKSQSGNYTYMDCK